jgi:hypothetical protein
MARAGCLIGRGERYYRRCCGGNGRNTEEAALSQARSFWVAGLVSSESGEPLIELSDENGILAQLSPSAARQVAGDIVTCTARAEADALIVKFFRDNEFPEGALAAAIQMFRDLRAKWDSEEIERLNEAPPHGGEL